MSSQAFPASKGPYYVQTPSLLNDFHKVQQTDMEFDQLSQLADSKYQFQISCQKSRFKKAIIAICILLFIVLILIFTKKEEKPKEEEKQNLLPKSRFPLTHLFHDSNFKDDGHLPSFQHLHTPLNFSYPTVGIPIPGKYFNSTRVLDKDLLQFDKIILDMFKPYNVQPLKYRTQIVSKSVMVMKTTEAMSYAKILLTTLKHSLIWASTASTTSAATSPLLTSCPTTSSTALTSIDLSAPPTRTTTYTKMFASARLVRRKTCSSGPWKT